MTKSQLAARAAARLPSRIDPDPIDAIAGSRVQRERNLTGAAIRAHSHEVVVRLLE